MVSQAPYRSRRIRGDCRRLARTLAALFVVLAAAADSAYAEQSPAEPTPPAVGAAAVAIPDQYKINMLIRTTLIALSQANQTGNYSVLRDLSTQQFQAMNTDARLAEIFAGLRQRNLDLSPVIFFDPKLLRAPAVQDNGILRLTGFLDTKPERVLFDMGFQSVEGQWKAVAFVGQRGGARPRHDHAGLCWHQPSRNALTSTGRLSHAHAPALIVCSRLVRAAIRR
jgi:hypothetical protein